MNTTRKIVTTLLSLLCVAVMAQPGFCSFWNPKTLMGDITKGFENAFAETTVRGVKIKVPTTIRLRETSFKRIVYDDVKIKQISGANVEVLSKQQIWNSIRPPVKEGTITRYNNVETFTGDMLRYSKEHAPDHIDYLRVPARDFVALLPEGEGMYQAWHFPDGLVVDVVGKGNKIEKVHLDYHVLVQQIDEAGAPTGPIRFLDKIDFFTLTNRYLRPVPQSFLDLPYRPIDPKELWEALGCSTEYVSDKQFFGDMRLLLENAPNETIDMLRVGRATDYPGMVWDIYMLPTETIKMNGNFPWKQTEHYVVIKNEIASNLDYLDVEEAEFRNRRRGDDVLTREEIEDYIYDNVEWY